MDIRLPFGRLLAHDHWANGQSLASVETMAEPPKKALELLGHLMGAEVSWLDRMTVGKDPEDWEVWENADAAWLRTAWREVLGARWSAFLANPDLCNPARHFTYVNFLGEIHKARVEDAITGLMLHSSHHRGQVAAAVRAAGGTPAVTDFMHAVRGGALA